MIEVFHGSWTKVDKPDLSFSRKTLDFGTGFYVTPVREQAVSWTSLQEHLPLEVEKHLSVWHPDLRRRMVPTNPV